MAETLANLVKGLERHGMSGTIEGDASRAIRAVATLEDAGPDEISFLSNPKYEKLLATTRAGAVIVGLKQGVPNGLTVVRTADPYAAVTAMIVALHGYRRHPGGGIHPSAVIDPSAEIGESANIHHGVTIGANARIGQNVVMYPGVYVAARCRIGDNCVLHPNVVLYEDCILGRRVTIHAGSVIGEDGLGYAPVGEKWHKIPQVGIVEIGDDVEIGANCTIDRATLGKTVIGAGSKFSNLIAIGHGTKIGTDCMFVAHVGIAGSVTVGNHVTMAGKVGVAGHLTIGDNAQLAAMAGVMNDIPANTRALGQPAMPMNDAKRVYASLPKLPELRERLRRLEAEVERLRAGVNPNVSSPP
ncbi:MAG: UDP-3-O-(3-hydroxymyristoyl)glucosamine N-acyltransferase [Phycisphaerae bacterium]|nr:UDP-3-O-(3-hydroxymyristoyl)glucosamine N-acyltransferase [Phycisphaerae bacterium]